MKTRILAVLLALAVVLALALPALAAVPADTVPYNTGTRHETCTALSTQAEQYYTDGAETLLKLSGSTSDSSLESMDSALYRALQSLMTDTMTDSVTYKSLPTYWARTDASQGKDGLLLFYSDTTGGRMSREHVWPKSRASFMQQNGGSDLHHLRPEDSGVNSTRSNYTMGNVLGVYPDCTTKAFDGKTVLWYSSKNDRVEVADNVKGDLARVLLYVYCRWGQPNLFEKVSTDNLPPYDSDDRENTGMPVIESLDTLLEWMQEDPVDTWEMSRNDCVQQVQGNRNVFIDYPEFAWLLFGRELPADYDTPSGYAREHGSDVENFTLTAASSDETRGTVTVRSHTVTAFPAEGYCVGGYTLTPADAAVVKQNGNVFTVSRMTKDCTLTVQFDPRTPSTVHFSVPEGVTAPADAAGYTGDTFTFPQPSGTPSDTAHDYTFLGWAAAPQTDTDSRPDFSAAGAEQMFTQAEQTYYALYYYSVDYVLEAGLMNGMGKGKFEPDTTLNRAMVATVLYRLSGDKVSATNAFPDVPANEWYGEAVAWAQQKGIVTGFEDGTFRPMEEISRQDMALMLQRYAKTVKGTDTTPTGDLSRWPDAGLVGSWAVDALRWCVGAGIINGKDGGLQPTGNATRAEFATILMRYAKL